MLVTAVFKTPDAIRDAVREAVERQLGDPAEAPTRDAADDLTEAIKEECQKVEEQIGKFVKYGELITVEFNTFDGTARVLPSGTVPPKRD